MKFEFQKFPIVFYMSLMLFDIPLLSATPEQIVSFDRESPSQLSHFPPLSPDFNPNTSIASDYSFLNQERTPISFAPPEGGLGLGQDEEVPVGENSLLLIACFSLIYALLVLIYDIKNQKKISNELIYKHTR